MAEKIVKNISSVCVSTTVIADILNLTTQRVGQLVAEGVIEKNPAKKFELVPTIKKYILHLKLKTDGKADERTIAQQLDAEKVRSERAKADMAEIKLARMQGTMHDAADVERVMTNMLSSMRAKLLTIPTKVAPQLIAQEDLSVIQDIVRRNIYEALDELTEYKPDMFYSEDYVELDPGDDATV